LKGLSYVFDIMTVTVADQNYYLVLCETIYAGPANTAAAAAAANDTTTTDSAATGSTDIHATKRLKPKCCILSEQRWR